MKLFWWNRKEYTEHDELVDREIDGIKEKQRKVEARLRKLETEADIVSRTTDQLSRRSRLTA